MRNTCVSTTTPSFLPNQVPSTTFAVFRATPGSVRRSSIVSGTSPPQVSRRRWQAPRIERVFARKNPVEWIISSRSAGSAAAKSAAVR